ncbi:preprotein translocase subunit SecA [Candidatus Wolfebacteria bacterium CG1_02_39_135]|uniref:Protein translocase subunit SecA n=4 Tax=Candidatus Wolfeibacteriota TaxID=1752735 RepID=A0A2M8D868_9BACT|nr:preprotein translocase subunit SecA [Parcubacteria group bacterium]OIO65333.1 MAG: preprotein translocase subunit SecA [Candidatus Wolfebacteria bacterium CG1_02_39_135]PIU98802.1 MAG: preprotein translocase subunit SecA [Candidatus Wolfebacteria bacterium CG03_land_8_20_14_0_80_39_317]PJB83333.1 MAG: preprotein translocase subunit SecA [Candidatus Wolfebacteria bacterium CG_4_9_14_0_8_um_filter_39_46]
MFSLFKKFFGKYDFEPLIKSINFQEPELEKLTDEELKGKGLDLKKTVQNGKSLDDALVEAFALIREAAKRTLNQRHFDVQLIGGIILHQGKIAEMLTGEGKTLAATAPVYLNALSGRGVHVITVNDYLARRDAVWMGQIYYALGLSIGCLTHEGAYLYDPEFTTQQIANSKAQSVDDKDKKRDVLGAFKVFQEFLRPISRKEAYLADITYGTNHEFGFDYLRDNLSYDLTQQVQVTRLHYAIIDEVDSILIDEARTPLIIAVPDTESSDYYRIFTRVVSQLSENEDYLVDEKMKTVSITDEGIDKVEKILKLKDLYGPENLRLVHYLEECLKAKTLFHRDKQYLIKNGEIIIVDEFTGRLMYGRRYSGGLHQAIEAKENVQVQQESRTFAQITIQNYFRLYKKIAGMTGTAQTSAEEFHKVYNLEVVSVPPNKPMIRKDNSDMIYKTLEAKCRAVIKEVKERHLEGQPILLGTTSITNNEIISDLLKQAGIPHEVLNAKNHEREGLIISQAGKLGAVTVATNMAGRGVDIVLAGNPPVPEEAQKIKELGGLYVIGTERHEARRIDNQLRGRSGRQGDPGTSRFFLSLEDDLLRIFGGEKIKSLMESFNLPEDQPIESKLVSKVVNEAQKKVEGFNFDSRKHLLEYDDILNKQRTTIYRKRQELLEKKSLPQILGMLDILWMNHLENMEALRESVGMRAYGQHDPLVEYRRESHIMFKDMMNGFDKWLEENKEKIEEAQKNMAATQNNTQTSKPQPSPEVLKKIGRNDPCWCGSKDSKTGKPIKYKRCHGV